MNSARSIVASAVGGLVLSGGIVVAIHSFTPPVSNTSVQRISAQEHSEAAQLAQVAQRNANVIHHQDVAQRELAVRARDKAAREARVAATHKAVTPPQPAASTSPAARVNLAPVQPSSVPTSGFSAAQGTAAQPIQTLSDAKVRGASNDVLLSAEYCLKLSENDTPSKVDLTGLAEASILLPIYLQEDPDTHYAAIGGETMRELVGDEINTLDNGSAYPCDPSTAQTLSTDLAAVSP
jgi:hypothetical protein